MRIRMLMQGAGFAAVLLLTPLALQVAHAEDRPTPSLRLQPPYLTEQADAVVLSAVLSDPAGVAIAGQRIAFFVHVDFDDAEPMLIGSRATDATGQATVNYQPTWDGEHRLTAEFDGTPTLMPVTASESMSVSGTNGSYIDQPRGLEAIRAWMPMTAGLVLLAVWGSLVSITVWTVRGIVVAGSDVGSAA
ncbi:MAG: hypothetical protein HOH95_14470 [Dehalococcoidia bacterium]|jgi:hypothetical protein|nr:hypothetical protein [Dehalococcoidia bacterium]